MAAGLVLVREAGGFVSDPDGSGDPLVTRSVACGNEALHRELVALLRGAGRAVDASVSLRHGLNGKAAGLIGRRGPGQIRAGMLERNDFGGDAPLASDAAAALPRPHGRVPGPGRVPRLHPLPAALGGLHGQSRPQRPILAVTLIGIVLAVRQVWRLFPEVRWVNDLQNETLLPADAPRLLAPMAGLSRAAPTGPRCRSGRRAPCSTPSRRASTRAASWCATSPACSSSSASSAPSGA